MSEDTTVTPTAHDHEWQRRQNVTSRGYRMTPYEVCVADGCDAARQVIEGERAVAEHPCGDYPAPCNCDDPETHDGAVPATERDALRAEVERLREVSAAQPYETERELAVALDEARRELADLRAGIEALLPGETVNVYAGGGNLVSQRRVVDPDHLRTLLAESGEQPGERDATPDEAHDIGYAKGHTDGYREALAEHPAPVVPDSTDVRGELLHVLDSHGIDTYIDGTGAEVGVQNLITDILAVVGQGVAEEIERLRDALTDDPDRAALELIVEDAARIARGVGS